MTVCIAGLCDNGTGCVLVSDQMTTAHFPIGYEFESEEVEKIAPVVDSVYVLAAGDVLFANVVIQAARSRLEEGKKGVGHVAEAVRAAYQETRRQHVIRTVLEPRGLDFNTYINIQQKLLLPVVQMIDQAFVQSNPGVDLIVAGKDNTGCHIYTVGNPGVSICHDPVGFVAIGSGGPHAVYYLIESGYKKSDTKARVEELVAKAKTRSEVAPGVGKGTRTVSV